MDAQNAAESIATKLPASASAPTAATASPPSHPLFPQDQPKKVSSPAPPVKKPPSVSAPVSSPHVKEKEPRRGPDDDPAADNNSEAETIVLAGKDGSPVKSRKVIKREDNSDDDRSGRGIDAQPKRKSSATKIESNGLAEGTISASSLPTDAAKRKRLMDQPRSKDSSALSSAPASPFNRPRRRSTDARPGSDSESVHARISKPPSKDKDPRDKDTSKSKSGDRLMSHKRKAPRAESDDEAEHENRKVRRQRTSTSIDASSSSQRPLHKDRDHPKLSSSKSTHDTSLRPRSISPHPRTHRRSASTQIVSQSSGLSQKKKRIPPPLTTDYLSDESSASGSPHIRSSTARGLTTPATAESAMSSAKNPAHKKHVDAHGQTQLAKACANGNYDNAKKRLEQRPEDLNLPDYAGNTPLQIAALQGHVEIVRLLIRAGCDIDCVNHDKDTPLLDAVDNGHLDVVEELLKAGVNPRKANVNGEEPLQRVKDEMDNADEIRAALKEARKNVGERRKTSEERPDPLDTLSSHGADSPRRSPAVPEPASSRRAASSRSHKLSNQMLYLHMDDDKTMRAAAGRGEVETVERILQVRERWDDAESMVAAARGGHDTVMNLLLAIGGANPDPRPIDSVPGDVATPMLAAIGQENIKVVELLLAQSDFDPTRRYRGETYYDIARKRQGPNWKDEEQILKNAYDAHRHAHRDPSKKSPSRREQDLKRSGRTESKDVDTTKTPKRKATSPSREGGRVTSKARTGDKEHKVASTHGSKSDDPMSPKKGPGRPKKDDRVLPTIAISDGETSPPGTKASKSKRPDPDIAALSSEGEAKPRKRLVSGRTLKEQREKNRRASMVSTSSSLREPSSPRDTRHDDPHEPPTERYHDRAKALKRDESRDRLSVSGENSAKRSRTSATPDYAASEKEGEPIKKRRLDVDKKERLPKPSSSPERSRKSATSRDTPGSAKHDDQPVRKHGDQLEKRDTATKPRRADGASDPTRRESGKPAASEKSIHVKSEDSDVVMRDADSTPSDESRVRAREDEKKRRAELEAKRKEKEKEIEERKRREEDERRQAELKKRQEAEESERKRVEQEERRREEEIRKNREAEEEKLRKEKEEEEQRQAARIRLEKEEEERKRQEEERARKEQEAAEARRKREDDERREQERLAREENRLRKLREEQERKRLEKLPAFLRWLDRSANAKTPEIAKRWFMLRGVRFDSIRPETAGTDQGRELWILNTQVAMLLGESDIQLTRFSGWERVPASLPAKHLVLGLAKPKPALLAPQEWDIGKEVPDYYYGKEPDQLTRQELRQLEEESKAKFLALDLFFVKLSDLMFTVPNIPHLRNIEIVVTFHEAAETMEKHDNLEHPSRWKDDPDAARYMGFSPRPKYFINGQLVREGKVDRTSASSTPWPESRVPRNGLVAVHPTDPHYARFAKEQGLEHLLSGLRTPPMIGAHTSPSRLFLQRGFGDLSPPQSDSTATANGDGHQPRSSTSSTAEQDKPLVNGNTKPVLAGSGANDNR